VQRAPQKSRIGGAGAVAPHRSAGIATAGPLTASRSRGGLATQLGGPVHPAELKHYNISIRHFISAAQWIRWLVRSARGEIGAKRAEIGPVAPERLGVYRPPRFSVLRRVAARWFRSRLPFPPLPALSHAGAPPSRPCSDPLQSLATANRRRTISRRSSPLLLRIMLLSKTHSCFFNMPA
jgi:hypothetical protein